MKLFGNTVDAESADPSDADRDYSPPPFDRREGAPSQGLVLLVPVPTLVLHW